MAARRTWMAVLIAVALITSTTSFAQMRPTGRIVGTVEDPTGAVVPGATVILTDEGTSQKQTTTAGPDGGFVFLSLQVGTYSVTVESPGFQQSVYTALKVDSSRTTNVRVQMKVGALAEKVEVQGAAEILETTSSTVATAVQVSDINNLPLSGRSVFPFVMLTAGAQMGGSTRNSTFQGLPQGALNITLDGINNNSNRYRTGGTGMFTFIEPRLGAIEEVSVTTNGSGAEAAAEGAMQMRFVTKRGTNALHGTAFWQVRNDILNANSWVNNADRTKKPILRLNEFGASLGGKILKDKLFFFANYEEMRQPSKVVLSTSILKPEVLTGMFNYLGTDNQVHSVNILQAAGAAGLPSTLNPEMAAILNRIDASRANGTVLPIGGDYLRDRLTWSDRQMALSRYPTTRLDYEISPKLRWHGIANMTWFNTDPSTFETYPGWGGKTSSKSTRWIGSSALEWTVSPNMMNEFNIGLQSNLEIFDPEASVDQFEDGRWLVFPLGIPGPNDRPGQSQTRRGLPLRRNNPILNLYDNFSWIKGKHTMTFGGALRRASMWESYYDVSWGGAGIPGWVIGADANDPITGVLNSTVLPRVYSGSQSDAWDLYALLTGRVEYIWGGRNVNEKTLTYEDYNPLLRREYQREFGFYFQDSYRVKPSLTLNYGLRWEFQGPIRNTNKTYTSPTLADLYGPSKRLFAPGEIDPNADPMLRQQSDVYDADYNNPAPNVGFAWNPSFQNGVLGKVLGNKKTVFRGNYGINYYAEGMLTFTYFAGSNPGLTQSMYLYPYWPGFGNPGDLTVSTKSVPLYTDPEKFEFPTSMKAFGLANQWFGGIAPNLKTPYVQNWSFGIQRELTKNTVVEARYVGNHGVHLWRAYNLNEVNIFENGFLNEFKAAQNNMNINLANGRSGFANNGLAGQVALPIMETAFGGPTGWQFSNQGFSNQVAQGQAGSLASSIATDPYYFCNLIGNQMEQCNWWYGKTTPGAYPINFFQLNPYAGSAVALGDQAWSNYHGLQLEVRQQYWHGLTLRGNYTWSKAFTNRFNDAATAWADSATLRNPKLDKAPSPWDIRHTFNTYFTYDLPFGKGRAFATSNAALDRIVGGWTISSIVRLQSGRVFKLTSGRYTVNGSDSGVVLKGVTVGDLQNMLEVSPGPTRDTYFAGSGLIGADGRINKDLVDLPTAPGEFGQMVYLYGPKFFNADFSVLKRIPVKERVNVEFWAEFLNVFNHSNWLVGGSGSAGSANTVWIDSTSFGRTRSLATSPRNIQFRLMLTF